VTTKVAEALWRLEHLTVIEFQYAFEQGCGAPGDVELFQPVLTEGAFLALWDYSTTASFDDVARFVDIPFAPTNLTSLYVDSDDIETSKSMYDILSILSENCQMLKFMALVSLRDAGTAFLENPFDETMIITMETLQPVLKLVNLTSLAMIDETRRVGSTIPSGLDATKGRICFSFRLASTISISSPSIHFLLSL
jgi:hypothetical protein